jgi:hypothetical protein
MPSHCGCTLSSTKPDPSTTSGVGRTSCCGELARGHRSVGGRRKQERWHYHCAAIFFEVSFGYSFVMSEKENPRPLAVTAGSEQSEV